MNTKHGILLVSIGLLLVFASVGTASGKIWYVDDSGGADFTNIQDAINAANESDTIFVYNGSYYERISISKSLTLIGENRSTNIIGLGSGKCVYITANNVTVDGFTIRNGDYGIYIENNACDIINNTIALNHDSGIWIGSSNNNSIINNSIVENDGDGIDVYYKFENSTICNNNISSNSDRGIYLYYYSSCNVISNNSINSNGYGGIKLYYSCDHNIISDNTISNNLYGDGIVLDISCYNEIYNNNIFMNHYGNLILKDGSNYNNITKNTVINGNVVFEDTYFNTIYHNNFNLSPYTVSDAGSTNSWDNDSTEGGNYWSGHICHGNPSNGSQPYIIDADSIDHYPFQDQNGWLFPVFSYSPKHPIINQLVTFDASSSTGNITNYEWGFGDGSNATGIIVTHSYSANRTYTVNLTVTDDNGATDTASKTITVSTTYIVVPEEEWNTTFGGTEYDHGYSIAQTSDGGYIITGYTDSYGAGSRDAWLIKTDSNGNEMWNKTFGGTGYDHGYSVGKTSDEGYIITGYTDSYGVGYKDVWLIKTDGNGNKIWNKTFGGSDSDWGYSVIQTADNGYIVTGCTKSYGAEDYVWLIKVGKGIENISPITSFTYSPENPIVNQTIIFDATSSSGFITNYE